MRPSLFAAAATAALLGAIPATAAPRYRLTEFTGGSAPRVITNRGAIAGESSGGAAGRLDDGSALFTPPAGYTNVYARGIAANGNVALIYQDGSLSGTNDRAAVGRPGAAPQYLTPLAGAAAAGAFGISESRIAGYSLASGSLSGVAGTPFLRASPPGSLRATVWTGIGMGGAATATALTNPFGSGNSVATAINANGIVGGIVTNASGQDRAVLWAADGTATTLGVQSLQTQSTVRDVNEAGDALGRTQGLAGTLATLWSQGNVYTLAGVGSHNVVQGRGLNDRGAAVGFANDNADGSILGLYWSFNGSGYDSYSLDSLVVNLGGWQTGAAQSINDRGTIVGFGTRPDGTAGAYILTAVPEPASWAMLIAGFGLVGVTARRQRSDVADRARAVA